MNEHYYLVSYEFGSAASEHKIIQKYTLNGEWVASFGTPYIYDDPLFPIVFANETFIACNSEHKHHCSTHKSHSCHDGLFRSGGAYVASHLSRFQSDVVKELVIEGRVTSRLCLKQALPYFGHCYPMMNISSDLCFSRKSFTIVTEITFIRKPCIQGECSFWTGCLFRGCRPEIGELLVAMDGEYRFTVTENSGFPQIRIHSFR